MSKIRKSRLFKLFAVRMAILLLINTAFQGASFASPLHHSLGVDTMGDETVTPADDVKKAELDATTALQDAGVLDALMSDANIPHDKKQDALAEFVLVCVHGKDPDQAIQAVADLGTDRQAAEEAARGWIATAVQMRGRGRGLGSADAGLVFNHRGPDSVNEKIVLALEWCLKECLAASDFDESYERFFGRKKGQAVRQERLTRQDAQEFVDRIRQLKGIKAQRQLRVTYSRAEEKDVPGIDELLEPDDFLILDKIAQEYVVTSEGVRLPVVYLPDN